MELQIFQDMKITILNSKHPSDKKLTAPEGVIHIKYFTVFEFLYEDHVTAFCSIPEGFLMKTSVQSIIPVHFLKDFRKQFGMFSIKAASPGHMIRKSNASASRGNQLRRIFDIVLSGNENR